MKVAAEAVKKTHRNKVTSAFGSVTIDSIGVISNIGPNSALESKQSILSDSFDY